ncbi:MAG: ATP-dependent helicase/nuclease subunit [Candidatus Sumerlaeota bacterium]|nr:ATP-dependent helicase/nuclease subunit [Candidatus Sumerlaeota bacterium]
MNWTTAQQHAITARGQNLLVNAGAGAGKTAALVERVYRIMTDAEHPVSLENMLIVTFTRAAAGEMRHRLSEKLREALAEALASDADGERIRLLQGQLTLLPRAPISTLDSFCLALLREYSDVIGLPPDFDLMDEEEAELVRQNVIDDAIEKALDEEDATRPVVLSILAQMSPAAGSGMLAGIVRKIHLFLDSLDDPRAFVTEALDELEEAADAAMPFEQTALGKRIRAHVAVPLEAALEAYEAFLAKVTPDALAMKWSKKIVEAAAANRKALKALLPLKAGEPLPDCTELLKLPRRSGVTKNCTEADIVVHAEAGVLGGALKDLRDDAAEFSGKSLDDLRAEAASTLPAARLLFVKLGTELLDVLLDRHLAMRRLTFAQVQRLALRTLTASDCGPTEVALRLREDYEHVLVDEFQDVNALQSRLLRAVARPAGEEGAPPANLFVVGDVKQSIYGFRQADPREFQRLYNSYGDYDPAAQAVPGARLDLPENFRSTPPLLDVLNAFFKRLFDPRIGQVAYDERHAFRPGRTDTPPKGPVLSFHLLAAEDDQPGDDGEQDDAGNDEHLESDEREAAFVARLIGELDVAPGDVAVLLRSGRGYATKLVEAFQQAGIPYHTQESIGFLSQQEVTDTLSLLRTIDNPYRDVALVGCLRGPAAEWNENDLARLRLIDRHGRLFDNLKRAAAGEADEALAARAAAFLERLGRWREMVRRESMGVFFGRLYEELLLRDRLATLPNGAQRVRNLEYLHARAVQYDSFRRKGLSQFLAFLDDLIDRGEDLGTPAAISADADVVRIMTMHKSKGLQFPVVVLPFLAKKFNLADARAPVLWDAREGFAVGFHPGRGYQEGGYAITRGLLVPVIENRLRSEELRLLYVAMTRAKERLLLTATAKKAAEKIEQWAQAAHLSPGELAAHTARAQSFLDFVCLGLCDRPEFAAINEVTAQSHLLDIRLVESLPPPPPPAITEAPNALEQLERARGKVDAMIGRVVRQSAEPPAVPLRAKVSATEAKRAYDSLFSPDNPPAILVRRSRAASSDDPEWWPMLLSAPAASSSGRRRGTLAHRLCALADLDELAKGKTVADELDRLTTEGFFTPEEAATIPTADIQKFFVQPGLGPRLLDARATARREVPFTARIARAEIDPDHADSEEFLIFQGIVDLLFEERDAPGAPARLVLVDFKTDRWDGTTSGLERLEAAYSPQIALYRIGIERALDRSVDEAWLYFLSGSVPIAPSDSDSGGNWRDWLRAACIGQNPHPPGAPS